LHPSTSTSVDDAYMARSAVIVEHVEAHDGRPLIRRRPRVAPLKFAQRSFGFAQHRLGDIVASVVLLAVSLAITLVIVVPVHSFIRGDWPAQFFPVYTFLGERLRAFDMPGWNPYQFSGAPFAGDPESGWMYVPAMAIYALLPAETATAAYIGLHIAFAGLALYAFARLLGLGVVGSLIGGASFAFAWVAPASMHLVIFFPVAIWLVVALAGVELAIRASTLAARFRSWLLAAFAISQILAIWLGQSSYYALLVIGGWIAYRTLLTPDQRSPFNARLSAFLMTSLAVFGFGIGLSAAGVLPRLKMVEQSILSGGVYDVISAWEEAQTGFSRPELMHEVLGGYTGTIWWYVGATAAALALTAPVVARRWRPMAFFVVVGAGSLILSLAERTPFHTVLYAILPRFEGLHEHSPERVLVLLAPTVAMLAAATVSYLPLWDRSPAILAATAAIPAAIVLALALSPIAGGALLSRESTIVVAAASALAVCFALTKSARVRQTALLGLIFLALWDPAGRIALLGFPDESRLESSLQGSITQDVGQFLYQNGAATFLHAATREAPARYAGYDPALLPDPATIESVAPKLGYRSLSNPSNTAGTWLLVHNWGTWFGVEDTQGYNPVQTQRYVEYIDALNGHRQEYHERDLFPAGLTSPLLDLLNARYLLVPADAPERAELAPLVEELPTVYEDEHVRILENPEALPRAWLVHEARQVEPGEALELLADGSIDPRQMALLEAAPPSLEPAPDPTAEAVTYLHTEPDRIELRVTAQTPALLVLSEVWDPGWSASVDGRAVPVYQADHVFRAVPVPPGQHHLVLTYDPPMLRLGMGITAIALVLGLGAAVWLGARGKHSESTDDIDGRR
jgi:hypothetical protein